MHAGAVDGCTNATPAWLPDALHRLSQPLTALQCVLHLGAHGAPQMLPDGVRQTIEDAMTQCDRMADIVAAMRTKLEAEGHTPAPDAARLEH